MGRTDWVRAPETRSATGRATMDEATSGQAAETRMAAVTA